MLRIEPVIQIHTLHAKPLLNNRQPLVKHSDRDAKSRSNSVTRNGHAVTEVNSSARPFYSENHQTMLKHSFVAEVDTRSRNRTSQSLSGHTARRVIREDCTLWDSELPGFGLRSYKSGRKLWVVRYKERSKLKHATLGAVEELDACTARAKAKALIAKGLLEGLPQASRTSDKGKRQPSFRDLVERFQHDQPFDWKPSTKKSNDQCIERALLPEFGALTVKEISRTDVNIWRDRMADRSGMFNRLIPLMSAVMTYAENLGWRPVGSNPCRGMKRYKRDEVGAFLTGPEYRRLSRMLQAEAAEQPGLVAAIRLALFTGARCKEVAALRWEWVQPPRLHLPDSKTGAKIILLNRQAIGILENLPNAASQGWVFPNRKGNGPINLSVLWAALRNKAGLPHIRLHDLRHSFASIAIMHGFKLHHIGKLLGHALPETTERYAHLSDEAVVDAAERVSQRISLNLRGLS